jgi:dissimilatory sulfite reductase (desulfoviridin) alpha/beta subunit
VIGGIDMSWKKDLSVGELRRRGIVKLKDKDMYAMWVKTACCNLSAEQLNKLADITEQYAKGYLLFTTRQIPMIPFVHLKDLEHVQEELSTVYLKLDRCGPTVRNVNVCYDSKICKEAITNPISLAEKLDNFFYVPTKNKVKLGVAGCKTDCIISRVLVDVGFVARDRNGIVGYDAFVGGRLGLNPFVGIKMAESLTEEACVTLVQNYFNLLGKEGKAEERGADLINRLGIEKVRSELNKELQRVSSLEPIECETKLGEKQTNTTILRIRATCGEVPTKQVRKIADIAEKYGNGIIHFSVRGSPEIRPKYRALRKVI